MSRFRVLLSISFILSLFLTFNPSCGGTAVVGYIINMTGTANVKGSSEKKAELMMSLHYKDKITVYPNSNIVVVFYKDGHMETALCNAKPYFVVEIGEASLSSLSGKGKIEEVESYGTISLPGTKEVTQLIGGSIGKGENDLSEEVQETIKFEKETAEKEISKNPSNDAPYRFMGNYLLGLNLYEEALDYYKKAKKINPSDKKLDEVINCLNKYLKSEK